MAKKNTQSTKAPVKKTVKVVTLGDVANEPIILPKPKETIDDKVNALQSSFQGKPPKKDAFMAAAKAHFHGHAISFVQSNPRQIFIVIDGLKNPKHFQLSL